jgi:hypothetical protein
MIQMTSLRVVFQLELCGSLVCLFRHVRISSYLHDGHISVDEERKGQNWNKSNTFPWFVKSSRVPLYGRYQDIVGTFLLCLPLLANININM